MHPGPQERAGNRAPMTRPFRAVINVALAMLAIACGRDPAARPGGPSESIDQGQQSPSSSPEGEVWSPPPNQVAVMITESDCMLDKAERSIRPSQLTFVALNHSGDFVAFDIGMLDDGHTFNELAEDIEESIRGPRQGGPLAQRPSYFQGSIVGDTTFGHGGRPGPSLLRVAPAMGKTWSYHRGAFDLADPRGTWAVICYRQSTQGRHLEPIGVVGPVEVGLASVSTMRGDIFVDVRTREAIPLPKSIRAIPGAGNYEVSPDGTMLLFDTQSDGAAISQIYVANVDGTSLHRLTNDRVGAMTGSWSPDGAWIVYVGRSKGTDVNEDVVLFILDVTTGETTRVLGGRAADLADPHFSPDGRSILTRLGALSAVPATLGEPTGLLDGVPFGWYSPDGTKIAFGRTGYWVEGHGGGSFGEIWLANADGSNPRRLAGDRSNSLLSPSWSPDGTRIATVRLGTEDEVVILDVLTKRLRQLGIAGGRVCWLDDDTLIVER